MEMYLAGVSVRRVEDITEVLWGTRVSPSTVRELNQKIYAHIEAWRNRPITGEHPYVFLDGVWLKRSWGGEVQSLAVLVALAVRADGHREILGVVEGAKEDAESWRRRSENRRVGDGVLRTGTLTIRGGFYDDRYPKMADESEDPKVIRYETPAGGLCVRRDRCGRSSFSTSGSLVVRGLQGKGPLSGAKPPGERTS